MGPSLALVLVGVVGGLGEARHIRIASLVCSILIRTSYMVVTPSQALSPCPSHPMGGGGGNAVIVRLPYRLMSHSQTHSSLLSPCERISFWPNISSHKQLAGRRRAVSQIVGPSSCLACRHDYKNYEIMDALLMVECPLLMKVSPQEEQTTGKQCFALS